MSVDEKDAEIERLKKKIEEYHHAFDDAAVTRWINFDQSPREILEQALSWEALVATDPAVSKMAAENKILWELVPYFDNDALRDFDEQLDMEVEEVLSRLDELRKGDGE